MPVMIYNEMLALTKDAMPGEVLVKMKKRMEMMNDLVDKIPTKKHSVIANINMSKIDLVERFKELY